MKQKPPVEDDKQFHRNFITWVDVPPAHYEFWFDRKEASQSNAALMKVWKLAKRVKIQFCKQLLEFTTGRKPQQKVVEAGRTVQHAICGFLFIGRSDDSTHGFSKWLSTWMS